MEQDYPNTDILEIVIGAFARCWCGLAPLVVTEAENGTLHKQSAIYL